MVLLELAAPAAASPVFWHWVPAAAKAACAGIVTLVTVKAIPPRACSDRASSPVIRLYDPDDPAEGPTRLSRHSAEDMFPSIQAHLVEQVTFPDMFAKLSLATNGFHEDNTIGRGAYGTVFCADLSGVSLAVKVSRESASKREIEILTSCPHPNIIALFDWTLQGSCYYLVLELMQQDLDNKLKHHLFDGWFFPCDERLAALRDVATALGFLHSRAPAAYHRDVKSANVLLKDGQAKLADFGTAVFGESSGIVGTPMLRCPSYERTGRFGPACKAFTFGMLATETIEGFQRFCSPCDRLVAPARGVWDLQWDRVKAATRIARACCSLELEMRPSLAAVAAELTCIGRADFQ